MTASHSALDPFRRWGYLQADLDPHGRLAPLPVPELDDSDQDPDSVQGRHLYCGSIGVEFMHIADAARREWVRERMESDPETPFVDRERACELLARAEVFEQFLQRRYLGAKRFSIEGVAAAVPMLAEIIETVFRQGARDIVLGTAHRGRLSLMVAIVEKSPEEIFAQFEDVDPKSALGGGDVKYHLGASGSFRTGSGESLRVSLVSNPSHLEAVDPVVLGRTRAKQRRLGDPGRLRIVPVTLHGDAAFAGQGVAAECLNMADLDGYTVGGTIHVVMNNLIGFTASPSQLHSSRYATDVAKRLPIPIFHVNGEDLDAVLRVARMAADFRTEFRTDVVIDLIGYRRWGHSEVDDPKVTAPRLYEVIESLPPLWKSWAKRIGWDEARRDELEAKMMKRYDLAQEAAKNEETRPKLFALSDYWSGYVGGRYDPSYEVDTGVDAERLAAVTERITSLPDGFEAHQKIRKGLEERARMGRGEHPVDWATAEALAIGSLLWDGTCVRLSGEDSRRGTFNQRHSVLFDVETGEEYCPLRHLHAEQGAFGCYDSPLSEFAVLGFEYGFSRDHPEALVLWEAQFGDFVNGAQVVLDQFLSAGEDKWGLLSGLVVLLPHGYEGQGPEHSSARPERILQLAAEDNMQVCQPTTAAQYFHLLRRQLLRKWRKPLVVFTPKSMLREHAARSPLAELTQGRFAPLLADVGESSREKDSCERILVATGKLVHELRAERKRGKHHAAVIALEQLYPLPERELAAELAQYPKSARVVWVQEEPGNMGAFAYILPELERLAGGRRVSAVRRTASASPATGSKRASEIEQHALVARAFTVGAGDASANHDGS